MTGVNCPECGAKSSVTDSRPHKRGIRRRRECYNGHRYTSMESIEVTSRPKRAKPKSQKVELMSLPLTYLTIDQKKRARQFFAAGWSAREVAPLFDLTLAELKK